MSCHPSLYASFLTRPLALYIMFRSDGSKPSNDGCKAEAQQQDVKATYLKASYLNADSQIPDIS